MTLDGFMEKITFDIDLGRQNLHRLRLETKGEEGCIPHREEWSKIDKMLGRVRGSCDRKDPKQVEVRQEMPLNAWLWSLEFHRQWQTSEGFLVGQCHDQSHAFGP